MRGNRLWTSRPPAVSQIARVSIRGGGAERQPIGRRKIDRLGAVEPGVEPGVVGVRKSDNKVALLLKGWADTWIKTPGPLGFRV